MRKEKKFQSRIEEGVRCNIAIFKLMEDYFQLLTDKKDLQEKDSVFPIAFMSGRSVVDTINLTEFGTTRILLKYNKLQVLFVFEVFLDGGEKQYTLTMTSIEKTNYDALFVYHDILGKSIKSSDIKGSYIHLHNSLSWEIKSLTPKTFNDIFLPISIAKEIYLYKQIFEDQNCLMRYLLVGIPGTGKTESTLVLSNEMMKAGVTIIKTSISSDFVEKVQLAELLEPSLIILDDLDLTLGNRNKGMFGELLKPFLDVLDGTEKIEANVGIIATTNSLALLDIAARRPGRFDKTIIFDSLTKSNISKIISKSLLVNFKVDSGEIRDAFLSEQIAQYYYSKKVTGAQIYNTTEFIFRKSLLRKQEEINSQWVLKEIEKELSIIDKIRVYNSEITETFKGEGSLGLGKSTESEGEEEMEYPVTENRKTLSENSGIAKAVDKSGTKGEGRQNAKYS